MAVLRREESDRDVFSLGGRQGASLETFQSPREISGRHVRCRPCHGRRGSIGKLAIHLFSSASVGCCPSSPILSRRTTSHRVPSGQSDLVQVALLKLHSRPGRRTAGASGSFMLTTTRKRVRGLAAGGQN